MNNAIPYRDWIRVIETEYLASFVKEGGSAIKFGVPLPPSEVETRAALFQELSCVAQNLGYMTAVVDAKETKVHMMHEIFFKIAEQIDWEALAREVVIRIAKDMGYDAGACSNGALLSCIAEQTGIEPPLLRQQFNRRLSDDVYRHRGLSKDFRVAMVQLCIAKLSGGDDGETTVRVLTDWLTGRNRRVSAVRQYAIFSTINRTNARFMFESLLNWVKFLGYSGLLLMMDISRVPLHPNPRDGQIYYSRIALLDAYEVLRQFIDSVGKIRNCLIMAAPGTNFLDEQTNSRGFGSYEALKFRVMDEVRDRDLANPMSTLVRLTN